ncbi:unnamed protein product [Danaus chrysippus]|uniref:(African queen) hypothetical protein n=1 Tax=Danaus chrysippus TaxID=151541 RepID=A0A8J2W697_9NEOP|nr:unnamed protein product [Danaus chrysippus]
MSSLRVARLASPNNSGLHSDSVARHDERILCRPPPHHTTLLLQANLTLVYVCRVVCRTGVVSSQDAVDGVSGPSRAGHDAAGPWPPHSLTTRSVTILSLERQLHTSMFSVSVCPCVRPRDPTLVL